MTHYIVIFFQSLHHIPRITPYTSKVFIKGAGANDVPLIVAGVAIVCRICFVLDNALTVDGFCAARYLRATVIQAITNAGSTGILIVASGSAVSPAHVPREPPTFSHTFFARYQS